MSRVKNYLSTPFLRSPYTYILASCSSSFASVIMHRLNAQTKLTAGTQLVHMHQVLKLTPLRG